MAAALVVAFVATGRLHGNGAVTRVEFGYFGATAVLCGLLWLVYRRGSAQSPQTAPAAAVMSVRRVIRRVAVTCITEQDNTPERRTSRSAC